MVLLGLDLMGCIQVEENGIPGPFSYAHILPSSRNGKGWIVHQVSNIGRLNVDFIELIQSLEEELARVKKPRALGKEERAILVGVATGPKWHEETSLDELADLASSDNIDVLGRVIQQVKKADPRFLIRKGKLMELVFQCVRTDADLLIFDSELTPTQVRSLTDFTELRIVDRNQLIFDIFARRAVTREGKIQVELAQLKYMLPRLATKNTAMSRLTGGIGGRGPGETKLEINRRRARERIAKLNHELELIKQQRVDRRKLRNRKQVPVVSIVGYTNAGKSTLLNALTHSQVNVQNRLFETLDPISKRLQFPKEREVIITDTVGFIRNLPESLMEAFVATTEELHDADLLLHVVDAASPRLNEQIKSVGRILEKLGLKTMPTLLVFNKADLLPHQQAQVMAQKKGGIAISAISPSTLSNLLYKIASAIWPNSSSPMT